MSDITYRLDPIAPATADALRTVGGPIHVADEHPGYPCRQCLRDAQIGEELVLVSHDPFDATSPYRCSSPIFLHRIPCGEPEPSHPLPRQLTGRQLSVRAFDPAAMMLDAAVIAGDDLPATIQRFLANPAVDHLHVHNAVRGCWATTVRRG